MIIRSTLKRHVFILFAMLQLNASAQEHFSTFNGLSPASQDQFLHLPSTHTFQKLFETDQPLSAGGVFGGNPDFTGYIGINGSSSNGYLCVNHEVDPGGVSILDLNLDAANQSWQITNSQGVDFSAVEGTSRNCSGGITPWGTVISCEENVDLTLNAKGYRRIGWSIEIDPATKSIVDQEGQFNNDDKLWALGNFSHENACILDNQRTVYQGIDAIQGYLYKFVADSPGDLSSGNLYVYKGPKDGNGNWIQIDNTTVEDRNNTVYYSSLVDATIFNGVEDIEYNPVDGYLYMAVKNEDQVYRFYDDNPLNSLTVSDFDTYVGGVGTSYIVDGIAESWGNGSDNLVFDDLGNLYVCQDANNLTVDNNYVWFVENGHTQQNPKVSIFARTPVGCEPTGVTFSPDYRYLFMSVMHPSSSSTSLQEDAVGNLVSFNTGTTFVVARNEHLGVPLYGLSCTEIVEPLNGAGGIASGTYLEWEYRPNATGYIIKVGTQPGIYNLMTIDAGNTNMYFLENLPFGEYIYVQIIPYDGNQQLNGCPEHFFSTTVSCSENVEGFNFIGSFQGHNYFESISFQNWDDAQNLAVQNSAYMVSINSMEENDFLKNNLDQICLIGLSDVQTEGNYIWSNGQAFSYSNFDDMGSDADDDYGAMYHWDGTWTMVNQYTEKPFVMELDCIIPNEVLSVQCPSSQIFQSVSGGAQLISWTAPSASTTCPDAIVSIMQINGPPQYSAFQIGQISAVTYSISDNCGNTELCSFQVGLVEECPALLHISTVTNPVHKSENTLSSDAQLAAGSDVLFTAGNCLELEPGFEVPIGASFEADIQICINSQ